MDTQRLGKLVGELRKIVAEFDGLAATSDGGGKVGAPWLRSALRARRLRGAYFDDRLFADPAWDMMLDLLAAQLEGRPVGISSLCLASGVPPTTALRWIQVLGRRGIIGRREDEVDRRRVFVELTEPAANRLQACLAQMQGVALSY